MTSFSRPSALLFSLVLCLSASAFAADPAVKTYEGEGEVMSADPVYSRVTISHDPIKGLPESGEVEYFTKTSEVLKGISRRDLVKFKIEESKGFAEVTELVKTGVAPEKKEGLPIGEAVQQVLEGTGEVAKTVVSPIEPAHEAVSGAVDTTTGATGEVLKDANPDVKKKF